MKVSDLRIGVKLGAGFLAVVLLTTVLGLIALVQMSRIHANAEEIATNLLPSVAQTGDRFPSRWPCGPRTSSGSRKPTSP
jgi:hypothetical protein